MAISPATGGFTRYLNHLRTSPRYLEMKKDIVAALNNIPIFSSQLYKIAENIHDHVSRLLIENGLFTTLGYKYFGPYDGHDVEALVAAMEKVKNLNRPVLLHVLTDKGKGNKNAEGDPEKYHGVSR
ncbi:MAG: 1-deoxy-D-xylulose-5-phosphate synthase N-terminal domain-containing protein [Planctomycetota bacterium]|nr:1-deoxy-D-xylulose-5-phosphate synthase N-terminal domain-containing protein [Planctomycetota bacterium]